MSLPDRHATDLGAPASPIQRWWWVFACALVALWTLLTLTASAPSGSEPSQVTIATAPGVEAVPYQESAP